MPRLLKITSIMQYLKKKLSDEVDLLQPDKHESILQVDTSFF